MPVNPDIIFILLYFQKKVYRQSETAPPGTAFNVYKFIAITPVRLEQSLFFSEPLKLRERQSMRELRLLYPL